jgi:hypothetical protein
MYEADQPLLLLYLVNVLQPVSATELRREFLKNFSGSPVSRSEFEALVLQLLHNRLILRREKLYAVTSTGLQRISTFGLSRARDRNRLFFIKRLL